MEQFQSYFNTIRQLAGYNDLALLTKRIIDLTLDSKNIEYYRAGVDFLDRIKGIPDDEKKGELLSMLDRLQLSLEQKANPVAKGNQTILTVENLIRSYKKSSFALGPISFEIQEKKIIGLVGENGNGKTTLLRTLCGELAPTSGSLRYLFPHKDPYDLRSKLIYIPQRTKSWHGSLLTNLYFTASSYGIKGEENQLLVELVIARMGLRKYRNFQWKDLSSGYKMRFELARALLRTPQLLLIDEPLANLDILAQQIVLDDFRDIASSPFRPLAIILSSQQLYEVEKTSDEVIFLKNGTHRNIPQDTDVTYTEIAKLIIEFESEYTHAQLKELLEPLGLEKLQLNGGTYVASFPNQVALHDFLSAFLKNNIPISYFRNISNSTRRFFLS